MNIFQLIKSVLDWEFERIKAPSRERRLNLINNRHSELSLAYGDLTDDNRVRPSYSDPATRFAYIYKYTTCHADIVYSCISAYKELARLFEGDGWIKIACIGGGPGSDLIGVLKYALLEKKVKSIKCFLLDKESAWGDTWSDIEEHSDDLPFRLSTHFQALDVTDATTWSAQTKYHSSDLFTFVYFLSEIYRYDTASRSFFEELVGRAGSGAHFLFIENDAPEFIAQIQRFSSEYGLRVVGSSSGTYQTDTNEEKTDLNPYFNELRDSPKIRARIYKALMVKP